METSATSPTSRRRLAAAIRANQLLLTALVVAVAHPLALHYTGFAPVRDLAPLDYPRLAGYPLRTVPGMPGMHGIDFSQIYLAARNLSRDRPVYFPVDPVKWRRKWSSTYHPLVHWLYLPIAELTFRNALVVHNLLGISLLLLCSFLALRSAGCLGAFPSVGLVVLAVIFLTPTGLMHLERGQMDLFTAASYACILALFAGGGAGWAFAAGLLSTLKVSAWLFVGLTWCAGSALRGWRDPALWWLPAAILAPTLAFPGQVIAWIPAFLYVAEDTSTGGPSFTRILPDWIAHGLPIASTLLLAAVCCASLRRRNGLADADLRGRLSGRISLPFAAALALQATGATPVTHDYRLIALLGLLPAVAVWCARGESIVPWLRHAVALGYVLVIVIAMRVPPFFGISYESMAWTLLASSLCFLAIAIALASLPSADPIEAAGGARAPSRADPI